jgi:hypothetical protein
MKKYNKYGLTAIKALEIYKVEESLRESWFSAAVELFESESSQKKGCPRSTFLGLCEEGLVKGIPKGNYTKSIDNKAYAIRAVAILKQNKHTTITPKELWDKLELGDKRSNSQMDVVLALREHGLIDK